MAAVPGNTGQGSATGGTGMVSAYWEKNIADSFMLRLVVWTLAILTILLQTLVILGCVPGDPGNSSALSQYFLLEFDATHLNSTDTTRLRIGYTAMCASISGGDESCTITVGKNSQSSIRYLSTGANDMGDFDKLRESEKISTALFQFALSLQNKVFCVLPALPGVLLALGIFVITIYGLMNRPWVGAASSWRQTQRNRKLDILRLAALALIGLSVGLSFAIATAVSILFAALSRATALADSTYSMFTVQTGGTALALHWLTVVFGIFFLGATFVTHAAMSSVSVRITPTDTPGTAGSSQFSAVGGQLEKARLLQDAEPMAMTSTSVRPLALRGGPARGGARGGNGVSRAGGRGGTAARMSPEDRADALNGMRTERGRQFRQG